jgi:hypothetical protein
MAKMLSNLDHARHVAEQFDLEFLRDEATGRYSLIDKRTQEIAFEGCTASRSLKEIERLLHEARHYDFIRGLSGFDDFIPFLIDDTLSPHDLFACLVANHCHRAWIPANPTDDFC